MTRQSTTPPSPDAILPAAFGAPVESAPAVAVFGTGTLSVASWSPPIVGGEEEKEIVEVDPGPTEEELAQQAREALVAETTATTRTQMEAQNAEALEAQAEELRAPMIHAAERLSQARYELTQRVHLDTVDLAVHLAEKILRRAIELDRSLVAENLEQALKAAGTLESLVIRMHPEDQEAIAQHAPAMAEAMADRPVEIALQADEELQPGDCVIRFDDGGVDARFTTQIASMANSVRDLVMQRTHTAEGTS